MNRTTLLLPLLAVIAAGCGNSNPSTDSGTPTDSSRGNDAGTTPNDGDTTVDDMPSTGSNRDFTLQARGLTSYQGSGLGVWVVDSTGQSVMGFGYADALRDADLEFRMPSLLPEGDYHADVFVDANHNGSFDSGETSWRLDIPTTGSGTAHLTLPGATNTDISSPARVLRSNFSATLSGFTADETGHRFELRVVDPGSLATLGAYLAPQLSGTSVNVSLPGIVDSGNAYNVDFFVDADGDGVYLGPPGDHAWRAMVQADSNGATLTWTRTDSFTEIDWR